MPDYRMDTSEFSRLLSRITDGKLVTDEELDRARRYVTGTQMERAMLMSALIKGYKAQQLASGDLKHAIVKLSRRIDMLKKLLAKIKEEETPVMTAAKPTRTSWSSSELGD